MRYKMELRDFDLQKVEGILRYSDERYFDTITHRLIVVGRHEKRLVLISYEEKNERIKPVTIHATTRQQINFRIKTGRFVYD